MSRRRMRRERRKKRRRRREKEESNPGIRYFMQWLERETKEHRGAGGGSMHTHTNIHMFTV